MEEQEEQLLGQISSNSADDVFSQAGSWVEKIGDLAIEYLPKVALAILVIIVGFWLIKKVNKLIEKALISSGIAKEVSSFLMSLINALFKIIVILSAASIVGIEIAAIMGLLATAGIAIGLSLQGSLSNFAAGIIVMIFKPYRVGDWIEIQEKFGKVEEIQIFNTKIVTPGRKTLIIPNGQVIEGIITNFSEKEVVRIELEITMPYAESFPRVQMIVMDVLETVPQVLSTPEAEVGILKYDSHSIVVGVRPYIKPDDYWEVTYEVYRKVKEAFHNENIKVAYSEGVEMGKIGQ